MDRDTIMAMLTLVATSGSVEPAVAADSNGDTISADADCDTFMTPDSGPESRPRSDTHASGSSVDTVVNVTVGIGGGAIATVGVGGGVGAGAGGAAPDAPQSVIARDVRGRVVQQDLAYTVASAQGLANVMMMRPPSRGVASVSVEFEPRPDVAPRRPRTRSGAGAALTGRLAALPSLADQAFLMRFQADRAREAARPRRLRRSVAPRPPPHRVRRRPI